MRPLRSLVPSPGTLVLELLVVLLTVAIPVPATAADFDTVILNGRVIDPETGLDAIRNVGITDGAITAISAFPLEGTTTINAQGVVVAPGWIDLHAHGLEIGALRMQAMQGVTTALELESGLLVCGLIIGAAPGEPIRRAMSE